MAQAKVWLLSLTRLRCPSAPRRAGTLPRPWTVCCPSSWTVPGSNRLPPACEAGALPSELTAHVERPGTACVFQTSPSHDGRPRSRRRWRSRARTGDPLLVVETRYRLRQSPMRPRACRTLDLMSRPTSRASSRPGMCAGLARLPCRPGLSSWSRVRSARHFSPRRHPFGRRRGRCGSRTRTGSPPHRFQGGCRRQSAGPSKVPLEGMGCPPPSLRAVGGSRTPDLDVRSVALYPAELQRHCVRERARIPGQ